MNNPKRPHHEKPKKSFTHVNEQGAVHMVDIGPKPVMERVARARGMIALLPETIRLIRENSIKKGDVLATARIAGISAAKRTFDLIPLCHQIPIDQVSIDFLVLEQGIEITVTTRCQARTGIEMEALTAVSLAALAIYDMCKAVDKQMRIGPIELISKEKHGIRD